MKRSSRAARRRYNFGSVSSAYSPAPGFFDELFDAPDRPRGPEAALTATLGRLGSERLRSAGERRDAIFVQQGITFDASGPDGGPTRDRPFPLDLIPRLLPAAEWRTIKRGLAQRVRALNLFVDDVYHEREIVREGIVPWQLVVTRPAFARAAHGIRPPGGVWCHVSGCDLVRDADGRWKLLEDNVRTPSGISYVLENRIAKDGRSADLATGTRRQGTNARLRDWGQGRGRCACRRRHHGSGWLAQTEARDLEPGELAQGPVGPRFPELGLGGVEDKPEEHVAESLVDEAARLRPESQSRPRSRRPQRSHVAGRPQGPRSGSRRRVRACRAHRQACRGSVRSRCR